MKTNNSKGLIIDPGLCRCCGATKKCRLLNVEYVWIGQKEVYSDMFVDTFGLLLSHLDGEPGDRLICATCVTRLRDASAFRKQVLLCEEGLLQSKILVHGTDDLIDTDIKQEADSKEDEINLNVLDRSTDNIGNEIKTVPVHFNDEDLDDHCSDIDTNIPADEEKLVKKTKKQAKKLKTIAKGKRKGDKASKGKNLVKKSKHGIPVEDRKMTQIDQIIKKIAKQKKVMDDDQKAFHNTVTVVENSFVCPFDTSFSDYYCTYCRQVYTEPDQLREHTLNHDPTKFKECVLNKKTPQIDILRIDCRLCAERIDDLNYLKNHLRNTHGKTLYDVTNEFLKFKLSSNLSCLECGSGFRFFHALKKHMAEHFGTWICDICGAHYFDERMLLIHQKSHQRIEENYPCSDCDKNFKSKHSRYLHETRTHKKEPTFQCPKCDEVLFSYSLRYRHMIEIHGEQRSFKCDQCERSYDSRKSLREHTRRFHAKIMKHQCDLCDKRFYIPSRLKEHMATHTGERNFRCEYCGKSYPRLRGLKVHMQSHISEKKYGCTLCSASFTQNVNLRNHIKRQHQSLELEESYND